MRQFLLILIIFVANTSVFGNSDIFNKANKAYTEKNYEESISLYQTLIDSGYTSFELYYNIANAYYKKEDIPSAILYYEKAIKLNPTSEDAIFNLRLANLQTADKIEPAQKLLLNKWWEALINSMTAAQWGILTVVLFFIAVLFFSIYLVSKGVTFKKIAFFIGLIVLLSGILSWMLAASQNHRITAENEGIIFTANVTVKSEPNGGTDLFVIHEGTKVEIIQESEEFVEIELSNGNAGWISKKDLRTI